MGARAEPAGRSPQREWWLRALAAPFAPRAVFAALRDDSDEAAEARAGAGARARVARRDRGRARRAGGAALLTTARRRSSSPSGRSSPGRSTAPVVYWLAGGLLLRPRAGSAARAAIGAARHLLAFALGAARALAASVWPVRLALYGGDLFRAGGADHGSGVVALHLRRARLRRCGPSRCSSSASAPSTAGRGARSAAAVALARRVPARARSSPRCSSVERLVASAASNAAQLLLRHRVGVLLLRERAACARRPRSVSSASTDLAARGRRSASRSAARGPRRGRAGRGRRAPGRRMPAPAPMPIVGIVERLRDRAPRPAPAPPRARSRSSPRRSSASASSIQRAAPARRCGPAP